MLGLVNDNMVNYQNTIPPDLSYMYQTNHFTVARNQIVILQYREEAGAPVQEVEIPIGNDPVIYTLNY